MKRKMPSTIVYTVEQYAQLPDDGYRAELVRGMLVREPQPAYGHGRLQAELIHRIKLFLEQSDLLAIEIVSPSNTAAQIREKVTDYLAAGAIRVGP
jgi:Uma2 family endonuclease